MGVDKPAFTYLPQGKILGSHMVVEMSGSPDAHTMFGWTLGGRVQRESSDRKVTHPSTIQALGGLTAEFPWDPG